MKKIDYSIGYKQMIEKNIQEVRNNIDEKYMKIKITNYCERYDLPYNFVKRKILTDNIFAISFSKDPSKQSFHQHYAAGFISSLPNVNNFQELPASGVNSLFVVDGVIVNRKNISNDNETKSIDFYWESTNKNGELIKFYAAHKHTDQDGGAQDNQYNDLKLFMKHAQKSEYENIYFLAIGDGPYYQRDEKKANKQIIRIDFMNEIFGAKHCKALTSNDIELFMNEIL